MIEHAQLLKELPKFPTEHFRGTLFRRVSLAALQSVKPHRFLYALGAGKEGARFTPRNGPPCLYASLEEVTAEAECKQDTFADFRRRAAPPAVVYSLEAELKSVLDLTDAAVLKKLKTTEQGLP